jgi:VWFA-related protein
MKLRVAFCIVASAALLVPIVSAQTAKQGSAKTRVNKPRTETAKKPGTETMKICQGVPIPAGYVIVAYMTTSTCPHGMYILKKQDPYSESLAISKRGATQPAGKTAPVTQPAGSSPSATQPAHTSASSPKSIGTSASGMRPRRVGDSQPRDDSFFSDDKTESPAGPPKLIGVYKDESPAGPPKLIGVGAMGTPVNVSTNAPSAPGPEEVSEGDVVRIDTSLVAVPVSVLDRHGRFIPDLKREDFSVFENGVEQSIAYFEPADKPFTVALLLDTSPSTQFHLWQIKEAAIAFAKQLRPQDRVLVVSFNDQVLLLTEVTNDLNIINSVIVQNANMGTATRLYDALDLVIKERLNKIKGRKAIVLFTDGVDTASYLATYQSTIREVEELDALIYPIQYDTTDYLRAMQGGGSVTVVTTRSNWPFPGTSSSQTTQTVPGQGNVLGPGGAPLPGSTRADYDRADQYLRELADKTAGRLYHANTVEQLAQAFSRIAEELRRQYSLGYYPQAVTAESGERRQIKVRVNRPSLVVSARDSYVRSAPAK